MVLAAGGLCFAGESAIVIDDADAGFADLTEYEGGAPVKDETIPSAPWAVFNGSAHSSLIAVRPAPLVHVSWTFDGLDPAKIYDVAVTWGMIWPAGNQAGDAAYTISGATTETVNLMHNVSPVGDLVEQDEGGRDFIFQRIGNVKPAGDGTIVLDLKDDDGDGIRAVIADAALVCAVAESEAAPLVLSVDRFDATNNMIHLLLDGMVEGKSYKVLKSETLEDDFVETGLTVTGATPQPFSVDADAEASPKQFFRAEEE